MRPPQARALCHVPQVSQQDQSLGMPPAAGSTSWTDVGHGPPTPVGCGTGGQEPAVLCVALLFSHASGPDACSPCQHYLPSRLDTLPDAEVDDDPGGDQAEDHLPVHLPWLAEAPRETQHLVPAEWGCAEHQHDTPSPRQHPPGSHTHSQNSMTGERLLVMSVQLKL